LIPVHVIVDPKLPVNGWYILLPQLYINELIHSLFLPDVELHP